MNKGTVCCPEGFSLTERNNASYLRWFSISTFSVILVFSVFFLRRIIARINLKISVFSHESEEKSLGIWRNSWDTSPIHKLNVSEKYWNSRIKIHSLEQKFVDTGLCVCSVLDEILLNIKVTDDSWTLWFTNDKRKRKKFL